MHESEEFKSFIENFSFSYTNENSKLILQYHLEGIFLILYFYFSLNLIKTINVTFNLRKCCQVILLMIYNWLFSHKDQHLVIRLFKLEVEYHRKNMTEVHLCIKKHFGTNETTKQFYSLAKQKYSIGILERILIKLNIKKQIWISVKNSASAIAQITSYYIDLIKDIVFITFFFEFLPKKISINSFEYNMFFLLCFSVLLPGEWICFLI